jgi:Ser/Thr protein kinase RdoA (MazF antagonist)
VCETAWRAAIHWRFYDEEAAISGAEHKTHGLQGSLEEPDWPQLTLAETDWLLRQYPGIDGAKRILSISPRPFSSASVAETEHGAVFVKRHHRSVRDREGLLEEHRLMAFLSKATWLDGNKLVQSPLRRADGESALEEGEWTYEVHPLATGVDVYEQALSWTPFFSVDHARAAGRALASLHCASEGYAAAARPARQLVTSFTIFAGEGAGGDVASDNRDNSPYKRMESYLECRPLLRDYAERRDWRESFRELLTPLYDNLRPWLRYLRPLWTHNDFHASNLMWSGDGGHTRVTGIIDFGLADVTNVVHDLATAIERNIIEWLRMDEPETNILHLDHLDALLEGYEELCPLSYEQAQALAAMLPLVHCEFALSETDYFLSVLSSEAKAFLAYEGYFLAHAQWFLSGQGQRLLEHLAEWASRPASRRFEGAVRACS